MGRKETSWLLDLIKDILSTALFCARYRKGVEELTRPGMRISLTLLSSATNYFNNLRDENDEPIYTYNDAYTRYSVRHSIKGGRCSALNQYYNSIVPDEVFNIISKPLVVNGNLCEIIDKHIDYTNQI